MKVALISFGFGEYSIRLANAIQEQGNEVLLGISTYDWENFESLANSGLQTALFAIPRLRQPIQQIQVVRQLMKQINDFKPDVIHIQQGHLWFNFALPFLRQYPLVITVHDPIHHVGDKESQKTPQFIVNYGFRQADRLITHAKQLKQILIDHHGFAADKVDIIPHIATGHLSESKAIINESKEILFFGRIWLYKGLQYLIDAEPLISQAVPDVKIVIAGRGEDFQPYQDRMVHPDKFEVLNRFIPDEEASELFLRSQVVVLPYIEATISGVVPMAYSAHKPVVATTVGGLPEMVDDDVTGFLVPPQDIQALADKIIYLLKNPDRCIEMGEKGYNKLMTEWSPEACAKQTVDSYKKVLAK